MSDERRGREGVTVVQAGETSNAAFFDAYAAPGRVGLVGGESLLELAIRRAQRRQVEGGRSSLWGHVFVCQGRRADGRHWVLESDLDVQRERTLLGVQEHPIDKYEDDAAYPNVALLDFGVSSARAQAMIGAGLRLLTDGTQYSLREIAALYVKLKAPHARGDDNALSRGDRAMFCSAFVQHLFLLELPVPDAEPIDFAPDVSTKLTTPEDIAATSTPHTAYMLTRSSAPKKR
jgi:hypothetical protein